MARLLESRRAAIGQLHERLLGFADQRNLLSFGNILLKWSYLDNVRVVLGQLVEVVVIVVDQKVDQCEELQEDFHQVELLEVVGAVDHSQIDNFAGEVDTMLASPFFNDAQ